MPHPPLLQLAALAILLLAAVLLVGSQALHGEDLEITYLANEGFLVRAGQTMVLIDALIGDGLRGYATLDRPTRERLESAQPPYDGVDLVLASHIHRDHFNAGSVARFLKANTTAQFVSTKDAARAVLEAAGASDLGERVHGYWPQEGAREQHRVRDVELTLFNLHHGRERPRTQNLGLLLRICGITVLHIGDTEADAHEMLTAGLMDLRPDVGLLPSWFLRPSRWSDTTTTVIKPLSIVAMHLPTRDAPAGYFYGEARDLDELTAILRARFPEAWIPTEQGDSRAFSCRVPPA